MLQRPLIDEDGDHMVESSGDEDSNPDEHLAEGGGTTMSGQDVIKGLVGTCGLDGASRIGPGVLHPEGLPDADRSVAGQGDGNGTGQGEGAGAARWMEGS